MGQWKMTDDMLEALRLAVYGMHNVRHEFVALEDDDMRRELTCSIAKSAKCDGGRAEYLRASKVYCAKCHARCNAERSRIVARRAAPEYAAVVKGISTAAQYRAALSKYNG